MNSKQWPGKAATGHLNDNGKVQDNDWLDYLNALDNIDASNAPNITWPLSPQK
ncbi:phage tail assembly chaperone gp38 [Salmonella enterica subsp. indica serovar 6,14,25:z10:1,(2),7 str. 1121]|uniref:Phage tail assembly chaperone gp38 n=2 Tax=Salmonella enterica TaxID=28901 RepID=V1HY60_SALER|nr:phage tail assembly chaperone gp38 [Salmonella enterica subsp. indica serovar 6,14,25:z10:1,(2),7 str. 1121]